MSVYHVALRLMNDDKTDAGTIVINGPPGGTGRWINFNTTYLPAKGKWVVGHAIGKSPQDSYFLDDQGTQLFMLASFIPMYDFSPGYRGTGKLINPTIPPDTYEIDFWLYEKDGRNADAVGSNSGDAN